MRFWVLLLLLASPARAAEPVPPARAAEPVPPARAAEPVSADWIAHDFRFHTGEVMPALKLHYTTLGAPGGEPVLILHGTAGSGGGDADAGLRGCAVRPGATVGCGHALHRPAGCDRRRAVGQAVGRNAGDIPEIRLRRHGAGTIPAGDRGPGLAPSAVGAGQLDGRHARLAVGRPLPRFHGHAGAHGFPADRDCRAQLDDAPDADRDHPA